jgi:hypothetical protein
LQGEPAWPGSFHRCTREKYCSRSS